MLLKRIIPCLDIRDGRVVKGVRFEGLRDVGDPAELAARYDRDGADEIVLLDVSATLEGRDTMVETIRSVREVVSVPIVAGGGVRTVEDAGRLLESGADKVSVNSAAVRRPELLTELADRFGRQCVALAIDATGTQRLQNSSLRPRRHPHAPPRLPLIIKGRVDGVVRAALDPAPAQHVLGRVPLGLSRR